MTDGGKKEGTVHRETQEISYILITIFYALIIIYS